VPLSPVFSRVCGSSATPDTVTETDSATTTATATSTPTAVPTPSSAETDQHTTEGAGELDEREIERYSLQYITSVGRVTISGPSSSSGLFLTVLSSSGVCPEMP
jgi:hypothetical protein